MDDNIFNVLTIDGLSYLWTTYIKPNLNKKVNKVEGKGLSTNDFTNEYKEQLINANNKVENIKNSDWN